MPAFRFFLLLSLGLLLGCAGYSALVLHHTTLADIRALDHVTQHLRWHIRPVTAPELHYTVLALRTLAGLAATVLLALASQAAIRREWAHTGREIGRALLALVHSFRQLPGGQRRLFWLLFGLLAALRTYFSLTKPLHAEEVASYEFFVRPGLLTTSAYYPVPNNHILSNTLSGWLYLLSPNFWWCMRLPVLLLSLTGTLGLFALLLKWADFRVAAVATFLFSGLQLSLYLASTGRGYWLLINLSGVAFFSTLGLSAAHSQRRRAAWAGLLLSGVLGLYTIPTFAYLLVSAFSWLGLVFITQRRWPELRQTVAAGLLLLGGTVLLYAPLLLVSGVGVLVGNGFVAPRPAGEFWSGLLACTWFNEGFLAGQRSLGAGLVLAVLAVVGGLLTRQHQPGGFPARLRRLGRPALWFCLTPYALVLAQRVFPPERVLLYKAFFFFILLALAVEWWLRQPLRAGAARWSRRALLAGAGVFGLYQAYSVERYSRGSQPGLAAYQTAFRWLATQPAGPVLAPPPVHNLFFRFFGHTLTPARHWRFDAQPRPTVRYAYIVTAPGGPAAYPSPPVFRNSEVVIYQLAQ